MNENESIAGIIDLLCDELEESWKRGEATSMDLRVDGVPDEFREKLFSELLQIEIHYRQRNGEQIDEREYLQRFGEFSSAIRSAFGNPAQEADATLASTNREIINDTRLSDVRWRGKTPKSSKTVRYFGKYELVEEIARGGMGVVFKARQVSLNRMVALKMILAGQLAGDEEVQRFRTEAEAAAHLDHPGIVPIFEIGEHEGQHYFSMGYVSGQSLANRVATGPLPHNEAVHLTRSICDAMTFAHDRGVIHRDLKPANILLDEKGQPKVTDFGLAKKTETDSNLTGTGQILGTPSYMAPEQASGKKSEVGPLADVYALGAILYCMLTGRPPHQAANPMDILMQVLERDPIPLRKLNPAIPTDVETICMKCLSKKTSDRYESASELAAELHRFQIGEPILARPVSRLERGFRWAKRHPALAALSAIVAVLTLTLAIGGPLAAVSQSRLRREATRQVANSRRTLGLATQSPADASVWFALAADIEEDTKRARVDYTRSVLWHSNFPKITTAFSVTGPLKEFEFTPTSRELSILTSDGRWQLIDVVTGQAREIEASINCLALSPTAPIAAVGLEDGTLIIYDLSLGKKILEVQLDSPANSLAFAPGGKKLGIGNKSLRIWSLANDRFLPGNAVHPTTIQCISFDVDGKRVGTTCSDQMARVFNLGETLAEEPNFEPKKNARFRGEGSTFASRHAPVHFINNKALDKRYNSKVADVVLLHPSDAEIAFFDAQNGEHIATEKPKYVYDIATSAKSDAFCCACFLRAKVYSNGNSRTVSHENAICRAAFLSQRNLLVTVSRDKTAKLTSLVNSRHSEVTLPHTDDIINVCASRDQPLFATYENNGLVRIWKLPESELFTSTVVPFDCRHTFFRVSPNEEYLVASGSYRRGALRKTAVLRLPELEVSQRLDCEGELVDAAFDQKGERVALLTKDRSSNCFVSCRPNGDSGGGFGPVNIGTGFWSINWNPHLPELVAVASDGSIRILDAFSGTVLNDIPKAYDGPKQEYLGYISPRFFQFQGERDFVAFGPLPRLSFFTNKKRRFIAKHEDVIRDFVYSKDRNSLFTSSNDHRICEWNATSGALVQTFEVSNWAINIRLNHDSTQLLVACRDKAAYLFDVNSGVQLCPPLQHQDEVYGVFFVSKERYVLTLDRHGHLQIWETENGLPVTQPVLLGGTKYRFIPYRAYLSSVHSQLYVGGNKELVCVNLRDLLAELERLCRPKRKELHKNLDYVKLMACRQIGDDGYFGTFTYKKWLEEWNATLDD